MKRPLKITLTEMSVYAMFGAMMYGSRLALSFLPNIHLLGMFTMMLTLVYRKKALIPIYVYVLIEGLFAGFNLWWIPYLYLWTVLWGVTMLLPQNLPRRWQWVVYPLVCAGHGLLFGTLYAPAQAILFHLNFPSTLAWIAAGLPWDAVHAIGDFTAAFLIIPLSELTRQLSARFLYR